MTDLAPTLAWIAPAIALAGAALVLLARTPRQADVVAWAAALPTAAVAGLLAVVALVAGDDAPLRGRWHEIDGASGAFLAVVAVVGLCSVLVSPFYLRTARRGWFSARRSRTSYYAALLIFWAALLVVPVAGNLALVWLVVEGTTAASALLVAFSGRRDALEAGWKYLVLTTLGLSVALLGIVVLAIAQARAGHHGLHALDWHAIEASAGGLDHGTVLLAFVLLLAGLATKIGWAPVHNWLPDAHSEAPAPISALLSAALLPTVLLVAWRCRATLDTAVGHGTADALFLGFGLASIVVAVPFLWRPLPFKRLLAYSSLEHMGVLALGVGFGTPLAMAGVVVHLAGHALAKSLGFYASLWLLRADPEASRAPAEGIAAHSVPTAAAMGVSLAALGGVPPSPLFVSEVLIILGGIQAGRTAVAAVAVVGLALGFLGLLHAFLAAVSCGQTRSRPPRRHRDRPLAVLAATLGVAMLALTAGALLLPGSALVDALAKGAL